ncbi:MAG: S8 family peptidase [Bacteroidota bacterium]
MKTIKTYISLLAFLSLCLLYAKASANDSTYIEVLLKPDSNATLLPTNTTPLSSHSVLNTLFTKYSVTAYDRIYLNSNSPELIRWMRILTDGDIDSLIIEINNNDLFETVIKKNVPKLLCSSPVSINDPWTLYSWTDRWHLDMLEAECAWSVPNVAANSVNQTVAVVDTEIDITHEDLQDDAIVSVTGTNTLTGKTRSHGTRSAGIIAARTDNGIGIAALGYNAKVAFYCESGWTLATNIYQAYQDGNKIISVSWTGSVNATAATEITEGGTVLVVAAGNTPDADCHLDIADIPGVILVGGVAPDNTYGSTHLFGETDNFARNTHVDLCAPAMNVGTTELPSHSIYIGAGGTSAAAPVVAATVALMLAANPCLKPGEVEDILKSTTDPIDDGYLYPGLLGTGRVNAYKAVLKASQWGNSDLEITTGMDITISNPMMYDNIYVRAGGKLTISNTTVFMDDMGKILVEAGGKLFINNSTISAHPVSDCIAEPYLWAGIEVEGQSGQDQNPTSNQGFLSITNNSILRDAKNAVCAFSTFIDGSIDWSKTGGIILAYNSTFTNNRRHVALISYHRPKVNSVEQNNMCRFTSCIFETDLTQLTASSQGAQKMFTNFDTKGVGVYGCTFRNTNGGVDMNITGADHGTGILSYDASMFIQDYITYIPSVTSTPSEFFDLSIGIEDYHTNGNPLKGHVIKKNIFVGNIYGIQQTNSSSSRIYRNDFVMEYPSGYPSYTKSGFWGINAGGFQMSENNFANAASTSFNDIGSTFNNSRFSGGGIYHLNVHSGTNIGAQTQHRNEQLSYRCNVHAGQMLAGLTLNPKFPSTSPKDPVAWLPDFGACPTNNIDRNNFFSSNIWDINNYTNNNKEYVIDPNESDRPDAMICQNMNITTCVAEIENSCEDLEPAEPSDWVEADDKLNNFNEKKAEVEFGKQALLDGSGPAIIELIELGTIPPAIDVYTMLIDNSPYLSDEALIKMLQYSQHLSNQEITDILVANSKLSQDVIDAFSFRELEPENLSAIEEAQANPSQREIQEMTVAENERELNNRRVELINYYLTASLTDTIINYDDSLVFFLGNQGDEVSLRQLASIYIDQGELELAQQKLDLLTANYITEENEYFVALMEVLMELKENEQNIFQISSTQEDIIRVVSESETSSAYYAKSILALVYDEYIVERPVDITESLGKRGRVTHVPETTAMSVNNDLLKIYPNPATQTTLISYTFIKPTNSPEIVVRTITGAVISSVKLNQLSGSHGINVEQLSAGLYFVELRANGNVVSIKKLIVSK